MAWCFLTHGLLATLTLSLTALSIALLGGTAWRLWWAPRALVFTVMILLRALVRARLRRGFHGRNHHRRW